MNFDLRSAARSVAQKVDRRLQAPPSQPKTRIAVQDDGVVLSNNHRILNFLGQGVVVSDDADNRRTNIFIPGFVLGGGAAVLASDAGAKAQVIVAGTDPEVAFPGWKTVGFNDSAWGAAVVVTPNSLDAALVPAGASAIWSKAGGAPYQVSGAQIGSDFSIPVTLIGGGNTGWALTIGNLYAIETIGGPWHASGATQPHFDLVQYSQDGGSTWRGIDASAIDAVENTSDANHWRVYFTASSTSLLARVNDAPALYGDNTAGISVRLSPAQAIEVLFRKGAVLASSAIANPVLTTAFDSNGSVWINNVAAGADTGSGAAGPQISTALAAGTLVAATNNVVAAWGKGIGGSTPDRGWVAFALTTSGGGANLGTNQLTADVVCTNANQYYDGPALTLPAGTWKLSGTITVYNASGVANMHWTAKLWNGTTVYASAEHTQATNLIVVSLSLHWVVTLTASTTVKISAACTTAGGKILSGNGSVPLNNNAGNTASTLVASAT